MSPFRKIFDAFARPFGARDNYGCRRGVSRRRRRVAAARLGGCEQLEPKQVMAANLLAAIADQALTSATPVTINLGNHFGESAVTGTVVKFETNAPLANPDFFVELFDQSGASRTRTTPLTVANFLSYVNDPDALDNYDETIVHRAVPGFVIQGGGYTAPDRAANLVGSDPVAVPQKPSVANEPGNLNARGTIAMAKLPNLPNSATNQFFFNLANNTSLNTDNGGFTVFGRVLGSGMTVIDTMASALTYDATTYYGNQAFDDFPLWNINSDNIIQPNDFVKFEDVAVVPEAALMSFTVTSANTAKLTAAIVNGQLVLTPVAGQTGAVNVTVTGRSALDNSTASGTFSVTLGQALSAVETDTSGTRLQRDASGNLYANDLPIRDSAGKHVSVNEYTGFSFVGVETVGGVNYLALRLDSTNELRVWTMTSSWSRSSAAVQVFQNNTSGYLAQELALGLDINRDGVRDGTSTTLVTGDTSGVQLRVGSDGKLYAAGFAIRDSVGKHIGQTEYAGFSFVGVETVGGVNYLALRLDSTNELRLWTMTSSWSRSSAPIQVFQNNTSGYLSQELALGLDINRDGVRDGTVAISVAALSSDTSGVQLSRDSAGKLYAGFAPIRDSAGKHLSVNEYTGFSFVGVEAVGGVNYLALRLDSTNELRVWTMTSSWSRSSAAVQVFQNNTSGYLAQELALGLDINRDGVRDGTAAISVTALSSDTSGVQLSRDSDGKLYAGFTPIRDSAGKHLSVNEYTGFSFVGVETVGGVNYLALRLDSTNELRVWTMTSSWSRSSAAVQVFQNNTSGYLAQELALGLDINRDGVRDGTSTTLVTGDTSGVQLRVGSDGKLYAAGFAIRDSVGKHIGQTEYAGFSFVGVETVGGVNYLALRLDSTNELRLWTMTSSWSRSSAPIQVFQNNTSGYLSQELALGLDINRDGVRDGTVAISVAALSSDTSGVRLSEDSTGKLYAGLTPIRDTAGNHLIKTSYTGFSFVGVETVGGVNYLALRLDSTNELRVWTMTSSWSRSSAAVQVFQNNTSGYLSQELALGLDINRDGVRDGTVAISVTALSSDTSGVQLSRDSDGKLYAGFTPIRDSAGKHLSVNEYTGFSFVGVETVGGVNYLALRLDSTNELRVWTMTSSWSRSSAAVQVFQNNTSGYLAQELALGLDINRDGRNDGTRIG